MGSRFRGNDSAGKFVFIRESVANDFDFELSGGNKWLKAQVV
jgi:hypothetical protein